MPYVTTDDHVKLYYEEAGQGTPIVFVHEFAGDYRAFETQVRHFSRRYRCIAFNARGYPPSEVPTDLEKYSQARACDDIRAVLDGLKIDQAHVVGVSMGAFATLHFGLTYPKRARSLVVCGAGYGAEPEKKAQFLEEAEIAAHKFETLGMRETTKTYALGPTRVQLQNKDPRGWEEFKLQLAEHSDQGAALTMRGVQKRRPSLYDLRDHMAKLTVPTLIVVGDEDDGCLNPGVMMKRTIPAAGLFIVPRTGHAVNLEEPALFNQFCEDLFHQVEAGRWGLRDPRSITDRIMVTDEKL